MFTKNVIFCIIQYYDEPQFQWILKHAINLTDSLLYKSLNLANQTFANTAEKFNIGVEGGFRMLSNICAGAYLPKC